MIIIDQADIEKVAAAALESPNKSARICLHDSHQEPIQEMIIAVVKDHPGPAYRHRGLRKTYSILSGILRVMFFSDNGEREEEVILGGPGPSHVVITFHGDRWHACEAISSTAVYLETLPGPFFPGRGERRPWQSQGA